MSSSYYTNIKLNLECNSLDFLTPSLAPEVKVMFPLCLNKQHAMKTARGVEILFHEFLELKTATVAGLRWYRSYLIY